MGPDADRHSDKGKDKAGKGDRQLLVQFDCHLAQRFILDPQASQFGNKLRYSHFRAGLGVGLLFLGKRCGEIQADVIETEIHLPVILQAGIDGVHAAVLESQRDDHRIGIRNEISPPGDDGARFTGDPVIGDEYPFQKISLD